MYKIMLVVDGFTRADAEDTAQLSYICTNRRIKADASRMDEEESVAA